MFGRQKENIIDELIPQELQVLQEHEENEEQEITFESLFKMEEDFHPELYSPTSPCLGDVELSCNSNLYFNF